MVDSILKGIKGFFIGDTDVDTLINNPEPTEINVETALKSPRRNKNNHAADYQIMIFEPKVYEDSLMISSQLRNGNAVMLNLRQVDAQEGTRLIDFLSGTTYAIDGSYRKIGENIFLFTPSNILVSDAEETSSINENIPSEGRSLFGRR